MKNTNAILIIILAILMLPFATRLQAQETETTKAEETQAEQTKPEETPAEETKAEESKQAEETKPEETPAEETKAEETPAEATPESEGITTEIDADVSVWIKEIDEDSSKAEEYGEIPNGFLVNSLRAELGMKDGRFLGIRARNIGLNNAQYGMESGVYGEYQLYIDYSKIPHLFSKDGVTMWNESSPGVWTLADSIQGAVQGLNPNPVDSNDPAYQAALTAQRQFISSLLTGSDPTFLGLQRNRGTVGFNYSMGVNWNYGIEYFRENRDGYRPYGASLGFSWVQELPERIDYNTDRVRAGVEYAKEGRSFTAAYEFSGFNNENQALIWDNPLRLTDRAEQSAGDGTSRGRIQLPTDNHSNMISLSGSSPIGRGKITGAFSYNTWSSETDLLPYTINSALPQEVLPAATFNGKLQNLTANIRYYSPVGANGIFTADYRLYDQSNDNDELLFTAFSPVDASVALDELHNHLFAFSTNTLDLAFQYSLGKSLRWLAGYTFKRWDREERDTDQTDTNSFTTGIDYLPADGVTVHARYQYDSRSSDEFDLGLPVYDVIPLRRFDVANLNRNLFRITADLELSEAAFLGFTAGVQNSDYPDSLFGLQEWNTYTVGLDFSYALSARSSFNAWYEYSQNNRDQKGRQSSSSPSTSPDFDWTAGLEDTFNTVGIGYLIDFKEGTWDWETDFIYASANGLEDLEGGPAIRATGAVDLPNVDDTEHYSLKTGLNVKAFPRARIGIWYWFDKYTIDDFSENDIQTDLITVVGPTGSTSTPGVILLNARQPDYLFHAGWVGLIYSW